MTLSRRTRSTRQAMASGTYSSIWQVPSPYIPPDSTHLSGAFAPIIESQITDSEGHPWKVNSKAFQGDIGGEFYTQKRYAYVTPRPVSIRENIGDPSGTLNILSYEGVAYPIVPNTAQFPDSGASANQALNQLGATAVSRCKPTNSVADVSVAVAEVVRESLPHHVGAQFWKDGTDAARKAGKEFLNFEFGWLPIVSEVNSFARAVSKADQLLAQYERDAGKLVRRRYNFPSKSASQSEVLQSGVAAALPPGITAFTNHGALGDLIRTRETVQRQWFSGAFTYGLPRGYNSRSAIQRHALLANKILGVTLTPEVLWNLAPWSWAVDWFSNVGDVVSTVSDWMFDGLVMRYGYMMEQSIVKDTYALTKSGHRGVTGGVAGLVLVTETKIRKRANPFGFGIAWEGLTATQLAIAAALGISKS